MRFPVIITPLLTGAVFLFFIAAGSNLQAAPPSLESVIAGLDSTAPSLVAAKHELAKSHAAYTSSRALPNPAAFAEGQSVRNSTSREQELTIGVKQPMGFLWSLKSKVNASRLAYEAEQSTYEETRRDVISRFVLTLAKYKSLEKQSAMLDSVLTAATQAKVAMDARFREGDVSNYDAQRVQAELIQVQNRRVTLTEELNRLGLQLITDTGLPVDQLRLLTISNPPAPLFKNGDEAVQCASQNRPYLLSAGKTVQSTAAARNASKWNQLPEFSLGIGQKTVDPDFSGLLWQAEVELPLWGQRRSERKLTQSDYDRATLQFQADRRLVEQETRYAYSQWTLLQTIQSSVQPYNVTDAQLSLDRGVRLYLSGDFNSLELVDAIRTSLDALQAYSDIQTAILAANIELRRVTGLTILE